MASTSSRPIVIHTTPPLQPLPASDAQSIYYIALFQLACPGRWAATVADWADNGGALPYITHLDHLIQPHHLFSLPNFTHPDEHLSSTQRAEAECWTAFIHGKVTDLVHHSLYSLPHNYSASVGKAHLSNLTFPTSQYIPQRLRGMHKARLQHVGLWGLGGMNENDLAVEDQKRLENLYVTAPGGTVAPRAWNGWKSGREFEDRRRKVGENELRNILRNAMDPLKRLLGNKPYFYGERPCSIDLWLFANLSLIITTSLPNPIFADLLRAEYSGLIHHHDRLLQLLFPVTSESRSSNYVSSWNQTPTITSSTPKLSLWQTIQASLTWSSSPAEASPTSSRTEKKKLNKSERDFRRARWLWYAGALGSMVVYLFASGLIQIEYVGKEEEDSMEEIEDEEEELSDDDEELVLDPEEEEDIIIVVEPEEELESADVEPDQEGPNPAPNEEGLEDIAEEVAEDIENPYNDRED
ncbi:hypothetical protein BD324DRAFT_602957 [Kockovaella imperatae]|uniref:GST C-terminal domain-containing protein n=1 Tax=Kockovaella imperatae TaxID=4999 RepID=A0A1Y1UC51_9TREE|nr:hypothetical protein BD324DRAFT_602957 [Kockovaella imperatae]ORX35620.1 hypothetical protein BD324DRAFT_602957 [Kockovaella imperatae]